MTKDPTLYTSAFFMALVLNFLVALNFTNNAIYPLYVTHIGGGAALVGLFMSAFSIASVLGRPVIGPLIDRFGVKPVMILGSLCIALPPLGYLALLDSGFHPLVWILRMIQGFGFGAHFTAFLTLAAQAAPENRRNESVAMYGISGLGANLVGPLTGEWLVRTHGLPTFFLTLTLVGILATLFATQLRPIPPKTDLPGIKQTFGIVFSSKALRLPLVLAALLAMSFATAIIFLAPLASQRSIQGFGLYFTGFSLAGIIIRLLGRKWTDRFGWRRILIPSFGLYVLGLLFIYFSQDHFHLMAAGILTGSAHGLAFPAVTSLGYTLAPERAKGTAMAFVTGMMDLGVFITGLTLGALAGLTGYSLVFPVATVAPVLAMILLILHVRRHPEHFARKVEEKT